MAFVEGFSNTSFRKNSGKSYRKNYGAKKRDPMFFLDRTKYFLKCAGHPERGNSEGADSGLGLRGFKFIHVTGTAGKGTVSTMLHNVLLAAGRSAGLFTSPYVTAATEEIKAGELYISPAKFADIVRSLKPAIARAAKGPFGAPSTFEIQLAVALIYFKRQKCEWVVLEVGLGGRYDATNAITDPVVTAITNIDYDHTEILGKTLGEIAHDKAGIIKRGGAFFTSEQRRGLLSFFEKECRKLGASFHFVGKSRDYAERNALLVRKISEHIGIPQKFIEEGMNETRLPCRFEIVSDKPLVILDGAHNRAKIASTVANLADLKYRRLIVIAGISNLKKDNRAILAPLVSCADHLVLTSFGSGERIGVHPQALLKLVNKMKDKSAMFKTTVADGPEEALKAALREAKSDDCILVTGSFFLAGKLREKWYPEAWVLKNRASFK
jgi:dihydrofolate synthase/folylpolyglutamate synthase